MQQFTPILLGSDINVYGMARSFHEAYGIKVQAWGASTLAPTRYSKIVDIEVHPGFTEDPEFIKVMREKIEEYKKHPEPVILISCGDGYSELLAKHKQELEEAFIVPYIDYALLEKLISKEGFYEVCEEYGLPYPKTKIITMSAYKDGSYADVPFPFPVALKPEDPVSWLDVQFEGRKKAFVIKDLDEFKDIVGKIYTNGYKEDLILQDFIPGDDSNMRVLNAYVDKNHQVKMMCLGHPLLEDPDPIAIGNYMVIAPDYDEKLYQTVQAFLEKINYTGMANFDIKYDVRDGQYKFFEINLRQGRSSFYVTLNGYNLAKWYVDDYVEDSLKDQPVVYGNQDPAKHKLWLGVPDKIFEQYAVDSLAKKEALALLRAGKVGTTVFYKPDMNIKRWLLMKHMYHNYYKDYQKYFKVNKEQYFEKK
ncbi:carboxylate--amine ligase [Lactobacillus delbrueckii]|uniref:carboxylate--amine ligase n=1 Tax=Lactobacillus delbrueckii TaxID=1584 RepID=UPI0005DECF12|nr:carboxylate--amine ligase [Lactobacillus delbrueckii]KIY24375.1 carboxylate--amine ligase [Lactobacillus delbrueckii subsp. bulgaricus]MBT9023646.1 carboxylate--amine ligase [Lactobacillus delbrueckii subsp. bulgaricus]MCD5459813.1 carboxylate--amine ligase [Lactobacillus delbrueckii subsp. bulgaricus]MCT3481097.1 carboxylate--amine ligase [Lactobacillus delbrueckii subsp. bulgaricus]MCT3494423.1 carboxylate--amine ligase [Lactobacillus delbrueckii subsp. bulgaricus]